MQRNFPAKLVLAVGGGLVLWFDILWAFLAFLRLGREALVAVNAGIIYRVLCREEAEPA